MARFSVYILECADATFYIGATSDLTRRLKQHNAAKAGARYTKARRPVVLRYSESWPTLGSALSREASLKKLSRAEKEVLIRTGAGKRRATISSLSRRHSSMGKGDNSQRKEKKKPKKDKEKKK